MRQRLTTMLPEVALAAGVVAAYSATLHVPLLLDDLPTIPGNPTLRELWPVSRVLFPPPEVYSAGRPLLNLSFALNYAVGGTAVVGYHLVNLAIHLAASFTLYGLARRALALPALGGRSLTQSRLAAAAVAALWALHPLQTASVTYVSQRAESLMGLFYLLTLYGFVRGVQGGARWLAASSVTCVCGMMTKEVMATAPLLVFLFDWQWVAGSAREAWRQRRSYYVSLAAGWAVLAWLMLGARLNQRAVGLGQGISWMDYARLECTAIVHYLRLAVWPDALVFDYGANLPRPDTGEVVVCALVLGSAVALGIFGLARKRRWALPLAAFFLLLAPTSSVVPVAGQPIAENRVYLPLAGLCAVVALVAGGWSARLRLAVFGGAILAGGLLTHARNADYRSAVSIWRDTVAKRPANERAWVHLSEALRASGDQPGAVDALGRGLQQRPQSAELHNNLGVALLGLGKVSEALAHFQTAIRLKPDYFGAHYNLGAAGFAAGNYAEALAAFMRALHLNPDSADAHQYAGLCLARGGNLAAALLHLEAAVRLDPANAQARANLEFLRGQSAPVSK